MTINDEFAVRLSEVLSAALGALLVHAPDVQQDLLPLAIALDDAIRDQISE